MTTLEFRNAFYAYLRANGLDRFPPAGPLVDRGSNLWNQATIARWKYLAFVPYQRLVESEGYTGDDLLLASLDAFNYSLDRYRMKIPFPLPGLTDEVNALDPRGWIENTPKRLWVALKNEQLKLDDLLQLLVPSGSAHAAR